MNVRLQELVADAAADIRCEVCRNPEDEEQMILCDSCDKGYHIFCLYVLFVHLVCAHPIRICANDSEYDLQYDACRCAVQEMHG